MSTTLLSLRKKTIPNSARQDDEDSAEALALDALIWLLQDQARAERFMTLTGLTADDLREGLGTRGVQAAVLEFLAGHEPDLLAAADALEVRPEAIAAARRELSA